MFVRPSILMNQFIKFPKKFRKLSVMLLSLPTPLILIKTPWKDAVNDFLEPLFCIVQVGLVTLAPQQLRDPYSEFHINHLIGGSAVAPGTEWVDASIL